MSLLTKAVSMTYRPRRLRATAVVGLIAMTAMAVGLLILHVQLQFEIRNLRIETRNFQKQRAVLESERNRLNSDVEGLKLGKRILEQAHGNGMVSFDPASADTLSISESRLSEWRQWEQDAPSPRGSQNWSSALRGDSAGAWNASSGARAKQGAGPRPSILDAVLKTKSDLKRSSPS